MLKKLSGLISIKDLPRKQNRKLPHQWIESSRVPRQLQQMQLQNELSIKKVLLFTLQTKSLSANRSGQFE